MFSWESPRIKKRVNLVPCELWRIGWISVASSGVALDEVTALKRTPFQRRKKTSIDKSMPLVKR